MKIGIQTWGSLGDVRPLLALADGLQGAGHEVSLVICGIDGTDYHALTSRHGVSLTLLDGLNITPEQGQQITRAIYNSRSPLDQVAAIMRLCFEPVEEAMFAAAQRLATDNDLLIGHYFVHPLQAAAEQAGRPYVSVMLAHGAIPSAYEHPNGAPLLGKPGHRLLWWVTKLALNRILKPVPNRLRQRLDLPLLDDVLTQSFIVQPLTLLATSPQLCPAQPDWPESIRTCGFLDMPNVAAEGALPAGLADFLAAGDAPVYMTFGSWMPHDIDNQQAALALLSEAARIAGCRAIIQAPSWAACGVASTAQVLYVTAAPHGAIFPHCSAIVHHGGAGTTQAASVAGKPSIVVAHISEQENWGRVLQRIGIGPRTLKRRSVTAHQLARQIALVQQTPSMAVRARSVGEAMRREHGVAEAVRLIEERFDRSGRRPQAA